jgi:hypothetical protein
VLGARPVDAPVAIVTRPGVAFFRKYLKTHPFGNAPSHLEKGTAPHPVPLPEGEGTRWPQPLLTHAGCCPYTP